MIKIHLFIILIIFSTLAFSQTKNKVKEKTKAIDLGSALIESNIRQPPTQVTENPNQISLTAKEVINEDFVEFEKSILDELKNDK